MKNNLTINRITHGGGFLHFLFLIVYFSIGVFALYVVGFIEYEFLKGIFSNPKYENWCLWTVIIFEGFKGFAIYFHRYVEYYSDFGLTLEKRLKLYLKLGRYIAFILSFVVGVAKVSEYLDSPRLEIVWSIEKKELAKSYAYKKRILIKERDSLNNKVMNFDKNRDKQIRKNINRLTYLDVSYYDESDIQKRAKAIREANNLQITSNSDLLSFEKERVKSLSSMIYRWNEITIDSIKQRKKRLSKDYAKIENKTIVGIYKLVEELGKKIGWNILFKEFKYSYSLLIAFLVSALLELVVMNSFNYSSYVFFARLDPKKNDTRVRKR